jgi:hypothetical protein
MLLGYHSVSVADECVVTLTVPANKRAFLCVALSRRLPDLFLLIPIGMVTGK